MNLKIVICWCFISISSTLGDPEKQSRVYGGSFARITDFPFVASIRTHNDNRLVCGGTIISRWNIITAAHCLSVFNGDYTNVRIFTGTASSIGYSGTGFEIEFVIFHPYYTASVSRFAVLRHDICIVKLRFPIEFNSYQNKIALPTRAPFGGNIALIYGWGEVENSYLIAARLRKTGVFVLDNLDCAGRIPVVLQEGQFCTFHSRGVGVCNGDAGGPVTSNGELYGIISYCFQCAQGYPDVHTKVHQYLSFIRNYLQD